MRVLIQRVSKASIDIDGIAGDSIDHGFVLFLGIEEADTEDDANWLVNKVCRMRLFNDENAVMNLDVNQVKGSVLVVSQFTLHANTKKGTRPSYIKAARPDHAIPLYELFVRQLKVQVGQKVFTGKFGAHMDVHLTNDGPVTIWLDSKNKAY